MLDTLNLVHNKYKYDQEFIKKAYFPIQRPEERKERRTNFMSFNSFTNENRAKVKVTALGNVHSRTHA